MLRLLVGFTSRKMWVLTLQKPSKSLLVQALTWVVGLSPQSGPWHSACAGPGPPEQGGDLRPGADLLPPKETAASAVAQRH